MGQQEVGNERVRSRLDVSWPSYLLAAAMLLLVNFPVILTAAVVMAASTDASEIDNFEKGEVAAKRDHALLINNKEYSVLADVTVKDTTLTSRNFNDVVPGIEILFHIRQGRIDQIIIILPS